MEQRINTFTDEDLKAAFYDEPHLGKLAVKFGVPPVNIWRRSAKLGLKYGNGGGKKDTIPLVEILEGLHPHYQTYKLNKRLIREGMLEEKCGVCGISEWMGAPLKLQLDHINGEGSDHRFENLRLLCPNCHSQTDTWCGQNKLTNH